MKIFRSILALVALSISAVASADEWHAPMLAPTPHDTHAVTPWEMLGETDGLGEIQSLETNFFKASTQEMVNYALNFLGKRYCPGGKGPSAFDCSGFTSFVFKKFGIKLGASSRDQGVQGTAVSMKDVRPGDLMFFAGRRGGSTIGHVGMVIENDAKTGKVKFIHASTKNGVVVQSFPDGAYYSKRFLQARRVTA